MAFRNKNSLSVSPARQAILTTIIYSDIFSFPLTKEELWQFLLSLKKISRPEFELSLSALKTQIVFHNGYFCLPGREAIVTLREKNLPEVAKKMQKAQWITKKLQIIPSILFIGISGGLSVGDAGKKDDIDLVFITKKNTLFISRLFILGVLELHGLRRKRNQKDAADTVCVNLLFDETALSWFANFQDVYTAREIAQLLPLFERENMYKKFISVNRWIEKFLPNADLDKTAVPKASQEGFRNCMNFIFINSIFEYVARSLQMSLMRRHQTREVVKKNVLAFHPIDYRFKILKQLRLKMRQFGLLTNF